MVTLPSLTGRIPTISKELLSKKKQSEKERAGRVSETASDQQKPGSPRIVKVSPGWESTGEQHPWEVLERRHQTSEYAGEDMVKRNGNVKGKSPSSIRTGRGDGGEGDQKVTAVAHSGE